MSLLDIVLNFLHLRKCYRYPDGGKKEEGTEFEKVRVVMEMR